jgi:cell division protein ZapA
MAMALLTLTINGRLYDVACDEEHVDRIRALAQDVDIRSQALSRQLGTQPEGRLLLMVALMLADELNEARLSLDQACDYVVRLEDADERIARGIAALADRVEGVVGRIERD